MLTAQCCLKTLQNAISALIQSIFALTAFIYNFNQHVGIEIANLCLHYNLILN